MKTHPPEPNLPTEVDDDVNVTEAIRVFWEDDGHLTIGSRPNLLPPGEWGRILALLALNIAYGHDHSLGHDHHFVMAMIKNGFDLELELRNGSKIAPGQLSLPPDQTIQ